MVHLIFKVYCIDFSFYLYGLQGGMDYSPLGRGYKGWVPFPVFTRTRVVKSQ